MEINKIYKGDEGDLILDTFFGSGQTGKACQMLNRNFIGMEKEEEFVDKASIYLNIERI